MKNLVEPLLEQQMWRLVYLRNRLHSNFLKHMQDHPKKKKDEVINKINDYTEQIEKLHNLL